MKVTEPLQVRQHNLLTNARYEMTAIEMNIVFCMLTKLRKDDKKGTMYQIHYSELGELQDSNKPDTHYTYFKEAARKLLTKHYLIPNGKDFLAINLFASIEYKNGLGMIELEISEKIRPYLLDLKENFTTYFVKSALQLKSKYAKRIYQLCSQWRDIGEIGYSLETLKKMLMLIDENGKEKLTEVFAFKKQVLEIAKVQINKQTDLKINYKLSKKNNRRAYDWVTFTIEVQNNKAVQAMAVAQSVPLTEEEERLQRLRECLKQLKIVKDSYISAICQRPDEFFKLYHFYQLNKEFIRNPGGYVLKSMGLL